MLVADIIILSVVSEIAAFHAHGVLQLRDVGVVSSYMLTNPLLLFSILKKESRKGAECKKR